MGGHLSDVHRERVRKTPGPGEYSVGGFRESTSVGLKRSPSYTMGTPRASQTGKMASDISSAKLGPGAYSPSAGSTFGPGAEKVLPATPKFSMGHKGGGKLDHAQRARASTPGIGTHTPRADNVAKRLTET